MKEAGITPIIMGGGEKWPMHFYWSYLVMRDGGADGLDQGDAPAEDGGFNNPTFVQGRQEAARSSPRSSRSRKAGSPRCTCRPQASGATARAPSS